MKKITFLLLLVPMCISAQTTKVFTINFSENDFSFIKNGDTLNILSVKENAFLRNDTLEPSLPVIGVNFLIGYMEDYAGFSYRCSEMLVESNVLIDYNPIDKPTNINQETTITRQIEYSKKSYPDENIQFVGTHKMDGFKFLSFIICPFRYDAENKKLFLKNEISLRLNLKPISSQEKPRLPGKNMQVFVKDLTINGTESDFLYPFSDRASQSTDTVSYEYIIVTNDTLKNAFEKLAHWKTLKGGRSKVITVEDCYVSYPNLNPQLAIKTVLADYYSSGMQYVLLAGDTDIVPVQLCYLPHWSNDTSDTPADLYYACLDDCFSWDANGNNVYGELNDSIDLCPEFIITRASVSSIEEAFIFIDRIIEYESSPKTEGWADNILSCGRMLYETTMKNNMEISDAQFQGEYTYENGVFPFWNGSLFELFDTYSSYSDGANYDATGDHFQTEFTKGYTFIDEYSHGWANKWGWLEDWTLYKLDKASSLINNGYSIITTTACYTNAFDKTSDDFPNETESYTTCLSESFMRNPDSGILAYWGSSREGWNNTSYYFNEKFYEYLLSGNDKQFGRASMSAKSAFIFLTNPTNYNKYRWLIMSLNPLGDPEMPVFIQTPLYFNDVTVSFLDGRLNVSTGINGCKICISSAADAGESLYKIFNNTNGVSINDVIEDCYLCITKQGYIPYIARVGNTVYLQNENITRNMSVFSSNTFIGNDVNSSMDYGPVTIHKNKVINRSTDSVTIKNDFEVENGAELEIQLP